MRLGDVVGFGYLHDLRRVIIHTHAEGVHSLCYRDGEVAVGTLAAIAGFWVVDYRLLPADPGRCPCRPDHERHRRPAGTDGSGGPVIRRIVTMLSIGMDSDSVAANVLAAVIVLLLAVIAIGILAAVGVLAAVHFGLLGVVLYAAGLVTVLLKLLEHLLAKEDQ